MTIRRMSRTAALGVIAMGWLALASPVAEAGVKVAVVAPRLVATFPTPTVSVHVAAPPVAHATWVEGTWTLDGHGRPLWVPGYWAIARPYPVAVIAPARPRGVTVVRHARVVR